MDMNEIAAIGVVGLAGVAALFILAYPRLRARRLRRAARRVGAMPGFTLPWQHLLDPAQRDRLEERSAEVLAAVRFVGCDGLEIDDRMRHVVAAQAALLTLGDRQAGFALPGEILLYPDAFYIPARAPDENGLIDDEPMLASGEAWETGRVILSWADIEAALAGADHNVVVHEFAHLLDFENPLAEGAPPMGDFGDWSSAFAEVFERLQAQGSPVLDIYGAENPAECFAVAVEAFFQRPAELAHAHGDVYRVLARYFGLDPASAPPRFSTPAIPK